MTAAQGATVAWQAKGVPPETTDASVTWGCVDASCREINLSSFLQPSGCGKVKVKATVNGVDSPDFEVTINSPARLSLNRAFVSHWEFGICGDPDPNKVGFCTKLIYGLEPACTGSGPLFKMDLSEDFASSLSNPAEPNNWSSFPNQGTSFQTFSDGTFVDEVGFGAVPGSVGGPEPPPEMPGPRRNPPVPLSSRWMIRYSQRFFAGSTIPAFGVFVQQDRLTYYLDHGDVDEIYSPLP